MRVHMPVILHAIPILYLLCFIPYLLLLIAYACLPNKESVDTNQKAKQLDKNRGYFSLE